MKTKRLILSFALFLSMTCSLMAQPQVVEHGEPADPGKNVLKRSFDSMVESSKPQSGGHITAGELTLSIAPSLTASERGLSHVFDSTLRRGVWGLNGAADYFPVKNVGVGIEAGITDWNDPGSLVIDYAAINGTLRAQIWSLVPSVSVGVGRDLIQGKCYTQLRPGVAFVFNDHIRLFTSGAYRWSEKGDSLILLTGLSVAFR